MRRDPTPPGAHLFPSDKTQFNTEEAAKYINRSVATIRKHIEAGNLKPDGKYGGRYNDRYFWYSRETLNRLYRDHCYTGKDEDPPLE